MMYALTIPGVPSLVLVSRGTVAVVVNISSFNAHVVTRALTIALFENVKSLFFSSILCCFFKLKYNPASVSSNIEADGLQFT